MTFTKAERRLKITQQRQQIARQKEAENILNTENKRYYDDFQTTLSSQLNLTASKTAMNVNPYVQDILSQICQAQEAGKSAETYFGCSAAELAINTAKELPAQWKWLTIISVTVMSLLGLLIAFLLRSGILTFIVLVSIGEWFITFWTTRFFRNKDERTRHYIRWGFNIAYGLLLLLIFFTIDFVFHFNGL